MQRSVVLSSGWDIMDFVRQLQKLAGGNVAFATIPVLDGAGWSDDGMQSVVRVDPRQVQDWVVGLLHEQDQGKTDELAYTRQDHGQRGQRHRYQRACGSGVKGVELQGFTTGSVGNNDGDHVPGSQVRAAKADDLGAQQVAKELGGLPVVADASIAPGSVRVVLANDYSGPGSGLGVVIRTASYRRPARSTSGPPTTRLPAVANPYRRLRRAGVHQLTTPTTLSGAILDPMLRADPVGPRITYYDDATGERIELSAVTLANWAAKTGNLLRDELAAGPASRVAILLPAHWQTAAVLFGVWWIGAQAILDDSPADVALCTADRLAEADAVVNSAAVAGEVAVLSLDPFGRPATGLPVGVTDYATAVRVHGDQIVPEHNPGPVLAGRSVEQILRDCAASAAARV